MAEVYENLMDVETPVLTDTVRLVTDSGSASKRALISALATLIVESYTGSSLAGTSQSLKAAIDAGAIAFADTDNGNIEITLGGA